MQSKTKKYFGLFLLIILSFATGFIVKSTDEVVITNIMITEAGNLIGLQFTTKEKDSMQVLLKEQLDYYKTIRDTKLKNSVVPAVSFNPIPIGFKNTNKKSSLNLSDYSNVIMPKDINDLAYYSIGQLSELLKTKKVTSTELTKMYLGRLKKFDPDLNCIITLTEELAFEQAKKADENFEKGIVLSPLQGIPYGVKDLLSTKNYKTTWGAMPYKDQYIDEDAEVVKKLNKAGAVLVAKLTLGALAMDDYWFGGRTRNPWDTSKGSSGSSAGPASAVSAGLVPFAIGTETWGSIISPSTVCGVSGLRPTYGRVSRTGAMALSWSMDKIGSICRNAEDLAIVFNSIYGNDLQDQTLYDYPFNYSNKIDFKKLKIGYLKNDFDKKYDFKLHDSLTLNTLKKLGADLIPIELPDIPVNAIQIILTAEAGAAFDDLTLSGRDDLLTRQGKYEWSNIFRASRFIPAVEYVNANRIRFLLIQKMYELMQKIDFYISPSWEGNNLLLTNLTGNPSVVVPNGFSKDGTPTSITFTGRLFDEGLIISAAKFFQDATNFHLKHPEMFK
ncbi:MAG: amidase [Ignavibacteriales bacterium CG12_big_fil_rev_8_21_14_0_65_30_8]|nr:MAG: amidase [Ignavibacteriales bacterium CG12_big_fil_rev_8_21_14_0_65_30_8]